MEQSLQPHQGSGAVASHSQVRKLRPVPGEWGPWMQSQVRA